MLIHYLFNYCYTRIRNLQKRRNQSSIVSKPKKVPVRIFEILNFDRFENVDVKRKQILTWYLPYTPDGVLDKILVHNLVSQTE